MVLSSWLISGAHILHWLNQWCSPLCSLQVAFSSKVIPLKPAEMKGLEQNMFSFLVSGTKEYQQPEVYQTHSRCNYHTLKASSVLHQNSLSLLPFPLHC